MYKIHVYILSKVLNITEIVLKISNIILKQDLNTIIL